LNESDSANDPNERCQTDEEIRRSERVPMVAESVVLFDKDGHLSALRDAARLVERKPVDPI